MFGVFTSAIYSLQPEFRPVCIYIYVICIRGVTVHICHDSVCTSVRGSRFDTISVQQEKYNTSAMLGVFSFILNRQ